MANPAPPPGAMPQLQPGQAPTPEQIQELQRQFQAEAQRLGITPQELGQRIRMQQAMMQQAAQQRAAQAGQPGQEGQGQFQRPSPEQIQQMQRALQAQAQAQAQARAAQGQQPQGQQQHSHPHPPAGQQVPIQPGPPKPEALALAKWLKGQELKSRPCILQEKRREMFKVKRAIRALQSPAYEKARSKNPLLPAVTDRASAEQAFKLLPLSMLAIRVTRIDPANPQMPPDQIKSKKGKDGKYLPWVVRIEQQQDTDDSYHYVWFYEGSQWKLYAYAAAALIGVIAVVLFPLWPLFMRQGVWYVSMASLGLLVAFFGLAIVRLIVFIITVLIGPQPGIWLFPNLFEDVGFFDSFKPGWDWRETPESRAQKKAEKKERKARKMEKKGKKGGGAAKALPATAPPAAAAAAAPAQPVDTAPASAGQAGSSTSAQPSEGTAERRNLSARVEEVEEE